MSPLGAEGLGNRVGVLPLFSVDGATFAAKTGVGGVDLDVAVRLNDRVSSFVWLAGGDGALEDLPSASEDNGAKWSAEGSSSV